MSVQVFRVPGRYSQHDLEMFFAISPGPINRQILVQTEEKPPREIVFLMESIESIHGSSSFGCLIQGKGAIFRKEDETHHIALVLRNDSFNQSSESFGISARANTDDAVELKALVTTFKNIMKEHDRLRKNVTNNELHTLRSAVHGPSTASTSFKPDTHGVDDEMDGGIHAIMQRLGAQL